LALLAGAILRLRGLGTPSLWTDELVSWWAVSGDSLGEVITRCATCTATPPLSFLLEHLSVSAFGASEWALRLPSALAGIAAVGLVFAAGWRMFGPAAAAVSALLMAIHPVHLWFSTDARPYALSILLAAGSTWALSEVLRSGRWGAVGAYAACTAALLYTQWVFVPLLFAHALVLALARRAGSPRIPPLRGAAAVGGAVLLALPLAGGFLEIAGRASSLVWRAQGEVPPGVYLFFRTTPLATALLVTAVLYAVRGQGIRARPGREAVVPRGHRGVDVMALALGFLVPSLALAMAAVLLDLHSLLKARYLTASLAPCVLLLGWALTRPAWAPGRMVLAGTYLVLILLTDVAPPLWSGTSFNMNTRAEDWRGAVRLLQSEVQPDDLVLLRSGLVETEGFYRGTFPEECLPYLAAPLSAFYLDSRPDWVLLPPTFEPAVDPGSYGERIGRHLSGRSRIWFLLMAPPDPAGYLRAVSDYVKETTGRTYVLRTEKFGQVIVARIDAVD
jgi:4-amino-4-deoxy-L-arabinose transferase-like glycosyltransferase